MKAAEMMPDVFSRPAILNTALMFHRRREEMRGRPSDVVQLVDGLRCEFRRGVVQRSIINYKRFTYLYLYQSITWRLRRVFAIHGATRTHRPNASSGTDMRSEPPERSVGRAGFAVSLCHPRMTDLSIPVRSWQLKYSKNCSVARAIVTS